MKKKLILLTLVFGLTIVSQSTFSLGMGNIQVYSSLDEPLRANIELIVSPDEDIQNLNVALASTADYQRVGLDKSFVPSNIAVALDPDNPNIINVTSNGPVSEPIVSLLLDVNWNNGRILREFTILLDPPSYEVRNADVQVNNVVMDQVEEAVTEDSSDSAPVLQERSDDTEQSVPTYTNEDVVQSEPATSDLQSRDTFADEVYVNEGDTLWSIANRNKMGGLSTNQMMIAIFNNNASAFIDNNINKLIKGSRLAMPSMADAEAISYSQALAEVESHNQNWAGSTATDYSTYQTTTDDDYDDDYSSSSLDYGVQLSGGDSEGSDSGQTNAEAGDDDSISLSDEDAYNQASEQAEMQERISELEDIVQQQQSVIEIQDGGLSNLENQLADANDADTEDEAMDEGLTDDSMVDDVWGTEVDGEDTTADDLDLQLTDVDTSGADDAAMTDTDAGVEDSSTDSATSEPAVTEPVDQSPPKFTATPVQTESMVDKTVNWVMDNLQWVLIGLVGLIVLIFVPRFLRNRGGDEEETSFLDDIKARNKDNEEVEDTAEMADTKLNAPLPEDDDAEEDVFADADEGDEEAGDVLAELDKSIMFDEQDDEQEDDISQLLDEAEEADTEAADDDGGFDLDGFLDDADEELAEAADEAEDDVAEADQEDGSVADTLSDDDFNFDLDELDDEDGDSTKTLERDLSDDQKAALGSEADDDPDDADDLSDDEFDLNLEDELADFDLDEPEDEADEAPVAEAVDESDTAAEDDEMNFDEDFDFDLDEELDDISVDEEGDASEEAAESSDDEFEDVLDLSDDDDDSFDIEEGEDTMDEELDLGLEGLLDEGDAIDTKLDLAKAYLDMGDNEGAKNLLEEVVSEGNEAQIEAARKLLDDM
jgi:pilus assembly protein FimV